MNDPPGLPCERPLGVAHEIQEEARLPVLIVVSSGFLMKTSQHAGTEQETERELPRKAFDVSSGDAPEPSASSSARYVWYVIFLLAVVNAFNYMDRMALAVLLPYVKAELHLSDSELGLLTGLAFSLFYALCGLPIAWWADRGVRRNIIALSLAVWSVMTALCGVAQNFFQLFAARVGVGAGEAGCTPSTQSVLCDYVPFDRRAGVLAIQGVGSMLGMMAGMTIAGWLGATLGWRWTLVALGLPGIAVALIVRFTLREPARGTFDQINAHVDSSIRQVLGVLWRVRTFRVVTLYYAANGFTQYGLHQWWPSFYERQFGLSLSSIGAYLGVALGLGGGFGLLFGGVLANRIARTDVRLPLVASTLVLMLAFPAAIASLFVPSVPLSLLCVGLTALFWSIPGGAVTATAMSVVPSQVRATAAAVNILFLAIFGFALGPFVVGLLSDFLAPVLGVESLRYALLAPACFLPVLAALAYMAAKSLSVDLQPSGARSVGERDASVVHAPNRSAQSCI